MATPTGEGLKDQILLRVAEWQATFERPLDAAKAEQLELARCNAIVEYFLANPFGGPSTVKKSANQALTSDSPVDVTSLSFPVLNGRLYQFRFDVIWQSTGTTLGIAIGVTIPAATRFTGIVRGMGSSDSAIGEIQGALTTSDDAVTIGIVPTANTDYLIITDGLLVPSADGVLQLRAANATITNAATVRSGSCGFLTDLGVL